MTPYVLGFMAFLLLVFLAFPNRVRGFINALLAAEAKHAEIKAAEKAGTPPPHVHGLTMTDTNDIRADDVRQAIDAAKRKRRTSKEKP